MIKSVILVGSVNSLKAAATMAGTFYALKDLGVEVRGLAGSSGSTVALPMLGMDLPIEETCRLVTSIKPSRLRDDDIWTSVLDAVRKKISFIPERKGSDGFRGMLRGNGVYFAMRSICKEIGCEKIEDAKIPFLIATCVIGGENLEDINPGIVSAYANLSQTEYDFDSGETAIAVRASTSIPGVFRPLYVKGIGTLVDGGTVDAIPVLPALKKFGPMDIVMADATSDVLEIPDVSRKQTLDNIVDILVASAYTTVRDSTLSRIDQARKELDAHGRRLIRVHPTNLGIKMFDTDKFPAAVREAKAQALQQLEPFFQ